MQRHPLRQALRLPQAALKRLVTGLLQLVLLANRPARLARSGFVLPTTVLMVLMVVLTATALTYRSFTRSDMAISQREQQVISNATTPAIDRAKAKLEFMFQNDRRFPSGVPASDILSDLMLVRSGPNAFNGVLNGRVQPLDGANDPYTLPGETRIDINRDNVLDNAWQFTTDINGDGVVDPTEIVVYSILVDDAGPGTANTIRVESPVNQAKADALVTRTGPLATTEASPACAGAIAEEGWQVVQQGTNSTLQKNFQVNAFVANANNANRTFETLEFQQSRTAARANKWGAWFRYDLDVSPGPAFNWNGAMHTDGSLFSFAPGGNGANDALRSHMISSHNSCLYSEEASEISLGDGVAGFQGQAVRGSMRDDNTTANGVTTFHVWNGRNQAPIIDRTLTNTTDSVRTTNNNNARPSDIAINPLVLFTQDTTQHINPAAWQRDPTWDDPNVDNFRRRGRIVNDAVARPFVDDFFRADNRWGPKPRYDSRDPSLDLVTQPAAITSGSPIGAIGKLTDEQNGFDGYWERQAIKSGLRLIMGQRLELGNANGWNSSPIGAALTDDNGGDPLYPARVTPVTGRYGESHEYLQRKALRDNLAAVQGLTVYHYTLPSLLEGGQFPAACMAMTAHPGTTETIFNSRTFDNYPQLDELRVNFLEGRGTNGWEFQFPNAFRTESGFVTEIALNRPLGNALRNLAYFAGDPLGGAPSFQPPLDNNVHPAPYLNMWGDFSPLRRVLANYDDDTGTARQRYDRLSPADKATLHSAACTLSLLAYNVNKEYEEYRNTIRNIAAGPAPITGNGNPFQSIGSQMRSRIRDISEYMTSASNNSPIAPGGLRPDELFTELGKTRDWEDNNISNTPCINGTVDAAGYQRNCDFGEYFSEYTRADWIRILQTTNATAAQITAITNFLTPIDLVNESTQILGILRDRRLGFRAGVPIIDVPPATPNAGNTVTWDPLTGYTQTINVNFSGGPSNNIPFKINCNPNLFGSTVAAGGGGTDDVAIMGLIACSRTSVTNIESSRIRYPSLYYLFPMVASHDIDGEGEHQQPPAEEYIFDPYVTTVNPIGSTTVVFRRVGTDAITGVGDIAAEPRPANPANWTVPASPGTALTTANINDRPFDINILGGAIQVPFLDKGVYNGREQLNARVLDLDLDALSQRTVPSPGSDRWLSADPDKQGEGVVYAFREDAVREDEIIRPRNAAGTLALCSGLDTSIAATAARRFNIETQANCRMRVEPGTTPVFQDPPLTEKRISLKPVDFVADPQRRVHGFRLRTASGRPADLSGPPAATPNGAPGTRLAGMTFVSDNSVYIQGDFNLHSTNNTRATIVEEFTTTLYNQNLANAFGLPFYDNRLANQLNLDTFATFTRDHWRPAEILADAITILSGDFRDGAVEDGFIRRTPANNGGATSSYLNQNRPTLAADQPNWLRESDGTSPVWVDRNGTYYRSDAAAPAIPAVPATPGDPTANPPIPPTPEIPEVPATFDIEPFYTIYRTDALWTNFTSDAQRRRNQQRAVETFVNATFISGLVPQRPQQNYGGLHNFVRFLEDWNATDLHIAGSFIQLNFSTNATGPFEHDAWHPTQNPDVTERLGYYVPPRRRWGYDVALLYVPPAPAARRFVNIGAPRSEYYRELPADDPYIVNLRCATRGTATDFVFDENIRGTTCPA